MTRTTIKPIPVYGDVLDDFNRVSVLTVADRVRHDIVLPVLGYRPDSALAKTNSRFMKSSNGFVVANKSIDVLEALQVKSGTVTAANRPLNVTLNQRGKWLGIWMFDRAVGDQLLILESSNGADIKTMDEDDPIFWFFCSSDNLYLTFSGTPIGGVGFRIYQLG